MKILSNFDTNLADTVYKEMKEKYWENDLLLIFRDKIFLILFFRIPLFFYILIFIWIIIFWLYVDYDDLILESMKWNILNFVLFCSVFFVAYWLLKKLIDYILDFAIINSDEIIAYNQSWLFTRQMRSIYVSKIKTISVNKDWILKSIFNYWNIKFLSEWDDKWSWDIELYFVYDPENVKLKIKDIISKSTNIE